MKKTLLAVLAIATSVGVLAQGTILNTNFPQVLNDGVNRMITDSDGVTGLGPEYWVQVYQGDTPLGSAVHFSAIPAAAGYWTDSSSIVSTSAPGETVSLTVRAWEPGADSYEAAMAGGLLTGMSDPFDQVLGGAGEPAGPPTEMWGLTAFSLVPEPSTAALGILGAVAFMLRRRK